MRVFIDADASHVTPEVARAASRLGLVVIFVRFFGFQPWLRSKLRASDLLVSDEPELTAFAREVGAVVLTPQGSLASSWNIPISCGSTFPPPTATGSPS